MKLKALIGTAIAVASIGCSDALVGPAPSTDHGALFDEIWKEFDLHYSFFQLKNVDWNAIGAKYRPQALAATTESDFATVVSNMLAELHDPHVSLTTSGPGSTMRYVSVYDTAAMYYSRPATMRKYVTGATTTSGGHIEYGRLSDNVGYASISSFMGDGWDGEMDEVLDRLAGVTSMVIDIRGNLGGNRNLAIDIAGRFANQTQTFGYIRLRNGTGHGDFTDYLPSQVSPKGHRFAGHVYVLTNRRDFSSAEDFVLAMRGTGNATVVGDTTAGVTGGPLARELANGWTYELSQWIEYTKDKQPFEGIGLAPDVVVKSNATALAASSDPSLERAVSLSAGR